MHLEPHGDWASQHGRLDCLKDLEDSGGYVGAECEKKHHMIMGMNALCTRIPMDGT